MAPSKKEEKKEAKEEVKKMSRHARAGINFPVSRLQRMLKKGRYAQRVSPGGAIYMAAVMEYLVAEVLELAGNMANQAKKTRITPRHIMMAIRGDVELDILYKGATFHQGGVAPHIASALLPPQHQNSNSSED